VFQSSAGLLPQRVVQRYVRPTSGSRDLDDVSEVRPHDERPLHQRRLQRRLCQGRSTAAGRRMLGTHFLWRQR